MPDLKAMLDSIIDKTNVEPTLSSANVTDGNLGAVHRVPCPTTLDTGAFKEKLSLYVLKDVVSAMLNDETSNLDEVIDSSILKHVNNDCGCTCYQYLDNTRNRLKSDLFADIIQEIDNKTAEAAKRVEETKDPSVVDKVDAKAILKNVDNYEMFRDKVQEETTNEVINNVANVVKNSGAAPTFSHLDEKMKIKSQEEATSESFIFRRCGELVYESASNGSKQLTADEGFDIAVVEFCLHALDRLTKTQPKIKSRYN